MKADAGKSGHLIRGKGGCYPGTWACVYRTFPGLLPQVSKWLIADAGCVHREFEHVAPCEDVRWCQVKPRRYEVTSCCRCAQDRRTCSHCQKPVQGRVSTTSICLQGSSANSWLHSHGCAGRLHSPRLCSKSDTLFHPRIREVKARSCWRRHTKTNYALPNSPTFLEKSISSANTFKGQKR